MLMVKLADRPIRTKITCQLMCLPVVDLLNLTQVSHVSFVSHFLLYDAGSY